MLNASLARKYYEAPNKEVRALVQEDAFVIFMAADITESLDPHTLGLVLECAHTAMMVAGPKAKPYDAFKLMGWTETTLTDDETKYLEKMHKQQIEDRGLH